jgi:hypothetical protein
VVRPSKPHRISSTVIDGGEESSALPVMDEPAIEQPRSPANAIRRGKRILNGMA